MRALITNSLLAKLGSKSKQYDVWDTKLPGFLLRVNTSGRKFYRCMYRKNGSRRFYTIGRVALMKPAEAREQAKIILGKVAQGLFPDQVNVDSVILTLKEFVLQEYEVWRLFNKKAGKGDLDRIKRNFFEIFGDVLLSEISAHLIEKWRLDRLKVGIKASTLNRDVNSLKTALSKAKEWGFIEINPLQDLKPLKVEKNGLIRYLNIEEETRLRLILDSRFAEIKKARSRANKWRKDRGYMIKPESPVYYIKPMILLAMNTGIRRGELFNITWSDVNFELATLTIRAEINKSSRIRYIPLNNEALQVLQKWRSLTTGENLVFSNNGLPFKSIKKAWSNLKRRAQIDNFRWHDFRHHFASKLVMAGVDLNTVRELLGHADISTTLRYAHLAPEHKANAVAKLLNPLMLEEDGAEYA